MQNYLQSPITFNGQLSKKPILLADSKARYIQQHHSLIQQFGYSIDFEYFGGARFFHYYSWLQQNLALKVEEYGQIVLYVWLGTCDLTDKFTVRQRVHGRYRNVKYIDLRHASDAISITYVQNQIDRFRQFVAYFPSVELVFLEIPCYSIVRYNRHLRCPNSDRFLPNEYILNERIGIINDYIKEVNSDSGFNTPRFKKDLIKYRKRPGKPQQRTLDYSGYFDGLHPGVTLSGIWMKRIVTHMLNACR